MAARPPFLSESTRRADMYLNGRKRVGNNFPGSMHSFDQDPKLESTSYTAPTAGR